jgi:hypothetical protein
MKRTLTISFLWLSLCVAIWLLLLFLTILKIMPVIQDIEFAFGIVAAVGEIVIIKNNLYKTKINE